MTWEYFQYSDGSGNYWRWSIYEIKAYHRTYDNGTTGTDYYASRIGEKWWGWFIYHDGTPLKSLEEAKAQVERHAKEYTPTPKEIETANLAWAHKLASK